MSSRREKKKVQEKGLAPSDTPFLFAQEVDEEGDQVYITNMRR